ncbi:lysozyme inhibitor LprI family protein [Acinetobacter bouvetii]|uniref:Lysozyme inhibitor LprI-like N-terminal domain-containing protein n=1 Tax=Acinetobacter bouvetii TaxID=202951 RepID=A0A811GD40_9GAMM|nr:lysozyme inhibitor LprI family protein [Acinetobacter bouvetii]CAB1212204.1 hypothetical protein SFB21_1003 [Acinetobacter bouvetii]
MRFAIPVILSLATLGANSVFAKGYSDEYNKCLNTSYGKTETVKDCVDKELKNQEKLLNKYYKNYLKNNESHQSSIEQQHKLWLNRVDQKCYLKVTSAYMAVKQSKCVLEMTMERVYYYQIK